MQYHTDKYFTENTCEFFSTSWERLGFSYNHPMTEKPIERPSNLKTMIELAEKLSEGFKFVRVDLYRLNDGTIYFGEMTFTPVSGMGKWYGKDMDLEFGNLIKL